MNINFEPLTQSKGFCDFLGVPLGADFEYTLLGHGEYNINYLFDKPITGEKLVLRVPIKSQMHLENQVRYEYEALRLLEPTGRTPKPLYIDDTKAYIPYGFLVMNYLPGRALIYEKDLVQGAACLADIHSLSVEQNHLIAPDNALGAMLLECQTMVKFYMDSTLADANIKKLLEELIVKGSKIVENTRISDDKCLINTELNSGNFLVNEGAKTYLVDWEKPLFAHFGQDLGHFLAPTTTLWKTDTILKENDIQNFMKEYAQASQHNKTPEELWAQTLPFFAMNCLRGITWSAMAFIEYSSPGRLLRDEYTFKKIKYYLTEDFLCMLKDDYFGG